MAAGISTTVRYLDQRWRQRGEAPKIGDGASRRAATTRHEVVVGDARGHHGSELDVSGFTLAGGVGVAPGGDEARLRSHYRREMMELIGALSGADRVYSLGHLVRTEEPAGFNAGYARFVHCDYNVARLDALSCGLLRRRGVEPIEGETYVWYNTWQPFDHAVAANPLGVIDVTSLGPDAVIDYRYTGYGEHGEAGELVSAPVYEAGHRWWHYPDMAVDEVLISKQLDPRTGRASQCPHTSFDNGAPADAPPRRSVETRVLAVFERGR